MTRNRLYVMYVLKFEKYDLILVSVGPVILTIPSYFTFTIKEHPRKYFYNETVGANDLELQNAMETNYTNYWQTGNDTWLMKKNSTQYYMYYR